MSEFDLKKYIYSIKDFPKKGIMFRDITPIVYYPEALKYVTDKFSEFARKIGAEVIVAPESRGFFFAPIVSLNLNLPFVPIRKPGKLPREIVSYTYEKEYGTDTLCVHKDSIKPGQKVLIIDDLVAVGGTSLAIKKLMESMGAEVVGFATIIELSGLPGRDLIKKETNYLSLITMSDSEE